MKRFNNAAVEKVIEWCSENGLQETTSDYGVGGDSPNVGYCTQTEYADKKLQIICKCNKDEGYWFSGYCLIKIWEDQVTVHNLLQKNNGEWDYRGSDSLEMGSRWCVHDANSFVRNIANPVTLDESVSDELKKWLADNTKYTPFPDLDELAEKVDIYSVYFDVYGYANRDANTGDVKLSSMNPISKMESSNYFGTEEMYAISGTVEKYIIASSSKEAYDKAVKSVNFGDILSGKIASGGVSLLSAKNKETKRTKTHEQIDR